METPVIPNDLELMDHVYEPAEDSFLLLDALEEDLVESFKDKPSDDILFALEVGCGSGIISTAVARCDKILNGRVPCVFAADINPYACLLTEKTGKANKVENSALHTVIMDGRLSQGNPFKIQFDLVLCNPPYVPVLPGEYKEDEDAGLLQKSWDGGSDGNRFIIPFLSNIRHLLKDNGVLYFLLSDWNNPDKLAKEIAVPNGLQGVQIMKRTAGRERLSVWKFHKLNASSGLT